jgi:hypothetical protein
MSVISRTSHGALIRATFTGLLGVSVGFGVVDARIAADISLHPSGHLPLYTLMVSATSNSPDIQTNGHVKTCRTGVFMDHDTQKYIRCNTYATAIH